MPHDELLPPCDGPKMHQFSDPNPKIEFEEVLDDEGEGHVLKVKINSKPFALKVFKFFDPIETRKHFQPPVDIEIPEHVFEYHVDPFYSECRAYGRIDEYYKDAIPEMYEEAIREFFRGKLKGEKRTLAAQCYGYLHLSAKDEEYLSKSYNLDWGRTKTDEGKPLRALVKQLIEPEDQPNTLQMRVNLRTLHGLGIFPNNTSPQNYRNSLLMSFSRAYTVFHCAIEDLASMQAAADRDMNLIDAMKS